MLLREPESTVSPARHHAPPSGERRDFAAALRSRVGAIGAAAILALFVAALDNAAVPSNVDELAASLGQAGGVVVRPTDLRWEKSGGAITDFVFGRSVLFLASATPDAPRDVYRARVRLAPEGKVVGIGAVHNLTSTPIGDDHALVVSGARAAYATSAFGQEQSVTALDLDGEGTQNETTKLHDRLMAYVTNLQQTGSGAGVGRIDITLDQPAQRVGLAFGRPLHPSDEGLPPTDAPTSLTIELADDAKSRGPSRVAHFDLVKNELLTAPQVHAEAGKHLPKWFVFWAVDTVRAVPWIGPAPIAWLEEKASSARDTLKQTAFKVTGGNEALAKEPEQAATPASILDASQASADLGHWPPAPVRSIWKTPEPGEGQWTEPKQPWIKRLPAAPGGEAPPLPFVTTFVRPDEERPYAKVLLVAMDMRQLDLDMEAGSEDPKPLTGPPGTGRIPRDPAVYTRVAAAFNGGFKTEHGNYGMMLKKRTLLPPQPGAATVILTKDGRVGMGSWGTAKDGSIHDVPAADIVSFRQNLDPLVDNDKVNPLNRWQWGFTLPGTSMQTERTGICVTNSGHLMYAWGDDLSATSLGKAMKMAGCLYAMHLDMNPHHTGLVFTNINEFKGGHYKSELLSTKMEIGTDRYLLYAPKDFFYVTLHDPTPPSVEGAGKWEPDPGAQPAPAWMAGLWHTQADKVELLDVEPARASFRVRTGTKEPDAKVGPARAHELAEDDAHRVLFALTLGTGESKHPRGLVTEGTVVFPMSASEGTGVLSVSDEGVIGIAHLREASGAKGDLVELPLLLDEGKPVAGSAGHARGASALGVTPAGRVYVARGAEASVSEIARVLERAGCVRAVLLDRGAGSHGGLFRAGTNTPPRSRYEDTTLYAMSKPLLPRGFRFEATTPVEPPAPKKK